MIYQLLTEGMDKREHAAFDRKLEEPAVQRAAAARDLLDRFGVKEQAPDGMMVDFG